MADFDDLRIDRDADEPFAGPPPSRGWAVVVLLACALAGAAIAGYLFLRRPAPGPADRSQAERPAPAADTRLPAEPGDDIPLPPLDESDALVRQLVAQLSSHPRVAAWLTTDQLIRNFTVVVVNIADGRTPSSHLRTLAPAGPFQVAGPQGRTRIDPRSFQRYDGHAAAVASIDARGAARLYATLKPRIEEAYRELGSPHGDFDRTLERAIGQLLKTPVVEGPPLVEPAAGTAFKYSDPALEALPSAQKQLLRMGPASVRVIQAKLREFATHAGIAHP